MNRLFGKIETVLCEDSQATDRTVDSAANGAPSSSSSISSNAFSSASGREKNHSTLLVAGFLGGFLQAGLFNPWDRALYLSIKEERAFLNRANFVNPFAGVSQTIFQRSISAGLYFPLEEIFADRLVSSELFGTTSKEIQNNRTLIALMAGLLAGASNGILMNPLAAVKYSFWGAKEAERYKTFAETAVEMFKKGGLRIYFVGAAATVSRDLVFGACYGVLRHELPWVKRSFQERIKEYRSSRAHAQQGDEQACGLAETGMARSSKSSSSSSSSGGGGRGRRGGSSSSIGKEDERGSKKSTVRVDSRSILPPQTSFTMNLIAASVATVLSAPWNYVRNVHYGTPMNEKPKSGYLIIRQLWEQAMQEKTFVSRMYHLQRQLRVGWGTARVGCGMAFSSQVYAFISKKMEGNKEN